MHFMQNSMQNCILLACAQDLNVTATQYQQRARHIPHTQRGITLFPRITQPTGHYCFISASATLYYACSHQALYAWCCPLVEGPHLQPPPCHRPGHEHTHASCPSFIVAASKHNGSGDSHTSNVSAGGTPLISRVARAHT